MKKLLTIVLFILFLFPISAYALEADGFEGVDVYTYYGTTADPIILAWDEPEGHVPATDDYELVLANPERSIELPLSIQSEITITAKMPKTGHWVVKIRTRRYDSVTELYEYSDWVLSTDPVFATVDDQPRGWWIFTWIASTGPIEGLSFSGPDSINGGR